MPAPEEVATHTSYTGACLTRVLAPKVRRRHLVRVILWNQSHGSSFLLIT
jgi:hypothetical protein